MRGVQESHKKQYIRADKKSGLLGGTCIKVSSFEGYVLSKKPFAQTPGRRDGLSKGAHKMLELMCRVHPTHIVTHKFLMGLTGKSHNTVYKYIRDANKHKLMVIYRLVSEDNVSIGVGYRPVTYLVNYKYTAAKKVNKKVRNSFILNKRVVRETIKENLVHSVCTRVRTDVVQNEEIRTGSVRTSVCTLPKTYEEIRTGGNSETGLKLTNLVTPTNKLTLKPYNSKERKMAQPSFNSSSSLSVPPSEFSRNVKQGRRTEKKCKESCRNEYRPIVEILLSLSSNGNSLDIENLPGPLARSIDRRINPQRLGTLTLPVAIQLRTLYDYELLPALSCLDLVRGFSEIMKSHACADSLKAIINSTVTTFAGVFPGQRQYHQYKTKLYGLDECIAFVRSSLTSYEKFMHEYSKQDYSALYNPIALTQAARMYKIDWRWCKTISYEDLFKLDIGSRAWLSRECEREPASFWEVFGLEVHCPVNILWWDEETRARRAFKRIGLNFEDVKKEISKVGTGYYDTTTIADIIAPHLNKAEIRNGKQ